MTAYAISFNVARRGLWNIRSASMCLLDRGKRGVNLLAGRMSSKGFALSRTRLGRTSSRHGAVIYIMESTPAMNASFTIRACPTAFPTVR